MSKTIASDAGHWYDSKTGEPRYTITGKNGKERATKITDARLNGWVPSCTTILKVMDAPGLKHYFRRQMWEAAVTTARLPNEIDDDHFKRCCEWADEHAELARNAGTDLHGAIELYCQGKPVPTVYQEHCNKVEIELEKVHIPILYGRAEHSFASPLGYGGKIDLHGDSWLVDFKSKERIEDGKKLDYDEHVIQLAAYAKGLNIEAPRCLNVFVGIQDKKVVIVEHDAVAVARGWEMFLACLSLWKIKHGYDPTMAANRSQSPATASEGKA